MGSNVTCWYHGIQETEIKGVELFWVDWVACI